MKIMVAKIPETGLFLEFEESSGDYPVLDKLEDCSFTAPLKIEIELQRVREAVQMKGRMRTEARLACCRCLKTFCQPLFSEFMLIYTPHPRKPSDSSGEVELSSADIGLMEFDGEIIDTHEAIHEEVLAAIPIKPLCKPNCKGLCSRCGKDLNSGPCGCETEDIDPRLAVLKNFKPQKK